MQSVLSDEIVECNTHRRKELDLQDDIRQTQEYQRVSVARAGYQYVKQSNLIDRRTCKMILDVHKSMI